MDDAPLPIDADVTLIRTDPDEDGPVVVPVNSLVITGSEPILVDCGTGDQAARWWQQVEDVVDPVDVRWVILSHDDPDHVGNLTSVIERCPHASVVCSWLLDDGEALQLGSRRLVVLRPPIHDTPSTRGVFDVASGAYWAADCFGLPVPHPADQVSDLDRDVWEEGMRAFQHRIDPSVSEVEPLRWRAAVGRVAGLDAKVLVSAHGPIIRRHDIGRALDLLAELPDLAPPLMWAEDASHG